MFRNEVRFYREIAPIVGVRVPACYRAEITDTGTLLVLEDLAGWQAGADPTQAVTVLSELHQRWTGLNPARWPWLRRAGAAARLVRDLYDATWPSLAARADLPPAVRRWGEKLLGHNEKAEHAAMTAGPLTLIHGDASSANMRTGPDGEIALLDWEDVSLAPGVLDLAWHLVSSTEPSRWDDVVATYANNAGLANAMPAVIVQGLLSLASHPPDTAEATSWVQRLHAAATTRELRGTALG